MSKTGPIAEFGERVESARIEAEMTQEQLAMRSGLDRTTITRLERGSGGAPSLITLLRLAGGLGREPATLLPAYRWVPPKQGPKPEGDFQPV